MNRTDHLERIVRYNNKEVFLGELLEALWGLTQVRGLGILAAIPEMTEERLAQALEDAYNPFTKQYKFDYVFGKPIKIRVESDGEILNTHLYDRDAGEGTFNLVMGLLT